MSQNSIEVDDNIKADMNILILSGSPRKGGNTDLLVEAFVKGASAEPDVSRVKTILVCRRTIWRLSMKR